MTRDVITIKYYYEKIPVKLIVKYRDIDGRDITSRDEEMHIIGDTYKTLPKEIENYHYERVIGEEEGILGKEGAEIVYIYKRKDAKVIVKYIEKNTNRILYEDIIEGKVGDSYKTDTIQIPGYKVANGSNTNYTGIMTEPTITEKYYYEKIQDNDITNNTNKSKNENIVSNTGGTNAIEPEVIKTATIIIKHVDENGNEIHKREEEIKNVGDKYKTYPLDIEGYVFDKVLGTAEGTLSSGGARITYQYKKQDATLVIRYLEKDTNRIVSNEDFIPYKLYSEYRTSQKEIDNFKFSGDGAEVKEGKMNKDIEYVTYYYEKIPSTVVIKYLTKDNEEPIKEEKIIQGYVGEKYIILRDKIAGYEALEETPERTDGTFSTATSYYTFYYKKLRQGKVIVKYINLDKKSEIEQAQEFEGYIGETYNIEPKKIKGFEVASDKMPENREGEFKEEDIEVKYYYRKVERVVLTDDVEFDETENVINTESGKNSTNINNYVVIILGIGIIILAIVVFYKIIRLFKKQ